MKIVPFNIWLALICALAGYLLGNIQTSLIVSRHYFHDDIRKHGSGNAGSTNMVRVFGIGPGIITFLGDFGKAIAGVLIGYLVMGRHGGYIGGFFTIIGHCLPVFAGFKGGKGVASACGFALITNPLGWVVTIVAVVILYIATKKVSIVSLGGIVVFIISCLIFRTGDWWLFIISLIASAIIFLRHAENIKRLMNGVEPKLIPKEQKRVK